MKPKKTNERLDFEVLQTVFMYCFAIIVCPVLTFFGSKAFIFEGLFGLNEVSTNVYSAVASVIVLHVALGMFIYKAYSDPTPLQKPGKQD
ncbi:hypothetical protein R5R35_000675 [Gryllus longicercus]|uniref:Vacuolar ATPase assembly integral membrane protein VMA21 homolog n=1 Tax=Gryllus longicercus TaxID=2509291 RepID=A0AAN9ZB19_9ORTH